jgi:hypothetical protein
MSAVSFVVQVWLLLVGLTAASIVYLLSTDLSSNILLAVLQSVLWQVKYIETPVLLHNT